MRVVKSENTVDLITTDNNNDNNNNNNNNNNNTQCVPKVLGLVFF